jgi:predicted nucleic acid-binding protein
MNDNFFIDTNIFVYSVLPGEVQKRVHALDLIDRAISTGKGVISYQVVQEFLNVAIRRYAQPMSIAECEKYLSTVFRSLLAVHSSQSLYIHALNLTRRHSLSWYDSLIVAAALEANCRTLYTEDLQHGQKFSDLRVVNPFA